jgi:formylglycine-generating enzyme required for sulfatase activity
MVSWNDVQEFIGRLNQQTGQHFRLPTDDEWYAACQADKKSEYCGSDTADDVAWYSDNSNNKTHPVGMKQPNAWGLYDMSGNVGEWTDTRYGTLKQFIECPGGSWIDNHKILRATSRCNNFSSSRGSYIGVRLAQDP